MARCFKVFIGQALLALNKRIVRSAPALREIGAITVR